MTLSRRDFLNVTAGAGAYVALAPQATVPALPVPPFEAVRPGWFDTPMRWAQLTLVENDPGQFDPQFWLDYFRRIKADAACLSAGGIVAYYPTEVPLHHRSSSLGSSDPFGTLVAGCRALKMHVIARTDPHAARDEVRAAHPDWIAAAAGRIPDPALGQQGTVGDVRARSLQLRIHGPGAPRDRHAGTRSTAFSRTGGRRRRSATACTASGTSRPPRGWTCRRRRTPRIRRGARSSNGARRG